MRPLAAVVLTLALLAAGCGPAKPAVIVPQAAAPASITGFQGVSLGSYPPPAAAFSHSGSAGVPLLDTVGGCTLRVGLPAWLPPAYSGPQAWNDLRTRRLGLERAVDVYPGVGTGSTPLRVSWGSTRHVGVPPGGESTPVDLGSGIVAQSLFAGMGNAVLYWKTGRWRYQVSGSIVPGSPDLTALGRRAAAAAAAFGPPIQEFDGRKVVAGSVSISGTAGHPFTSVHFHLAARSRCGYSVWVPGSLRAAFRTASSLTPVPPSLTAVSMPSARTAFVGGAGGELWRTEDAGRTWSRLPRRLPGPITRLAFFDARVGLAVADHDLLRTADGGNTWRTVFSEFSGGGPWIFGSQVYVVTRKEPSGPGPAAWQVWSSTDRGRHWRAVGGSFLPPPTSALYDVQVASPGLWVAHRDVSCAGQGVHHLLAVSRDGGGTWRKVLRIPQPFTGTLPLAILTSAHWIVVGEAGCNVAPVPLLFATADAGATWHAVGARTVNADRVSLAGVSFSDASHGLAVGTTLGPRFPCSGGYCAASTNHAFVAQTTDGGRTWRRLKTPGLPGLAAVACADAVHCLVIGRTPVVGRSVSESPR
ncbi:MAG: hypothetical protein M0031_08615 [Thermaerobacter sp.]|nr:hypothetical protein [Thermaerobacter sp.]